MKIIKPQKISVLHRVFEHRGRKLFVPTVMIAFPLAEPEILLHEVVLWKSVASELGEGTAFDEAMFKPRAEALLSGSAYPPGGKRAAACAARMQVGSVDKTVYVVGDRHWTTLGPSDPAPFRSMPLDWTRAFGGESFADNPVGRGADKVPEGGKARQPLPNLEQPDRLVKSPHDRPPPASFAPIPFHWPQRQALAGTYDESWRKTRYPGFPDDLDLEMFNVAPRDQRFGGYLDGGEPFLLENLHPELSRIEGRLPTHRARCFVTRAGHDGEGPPPLEEIELRRDTVHFFPSAGLGVILFRGILPIDQDDASDLLHLVACAEAAGEVKPRSHYAQAFARRLDKERGALAALKESELLPPRPDGRAALPIERYGDMTELLAHEDLLAKNQRRGAEKRLDVAREACREAGIDPDEHFPLPPPPPPVPALEDLEEAVDDIQRQADQAVKDAEERGAALRAKAEAALAEAGIGELDAAGGGGPPAFSAEAQLESIRQQIALLRIGGQATDALEAQLGDARFVEQLQQAERSLKDAYRRFGHHYPAARVEADRAAALRAEVIRARDAGESLAGRDLTGADLSGLDLRGADLAEAFLEKADLSGANLEEANLERAVLTRATLAETRLAKAKLGGANFGDATLRDVVFDDADGTGAVFGKARLERVSLAGVALEGADFFEATFAEVSLARAHAKKTFFFRLDLRGVDFSASEIVDCAFIESTLDGARFDRATLTGTAFVDCRAEDASFVEANAETLRIAKDSRFARARFTSARLERAALRGTDLSGADFRGAAAANADFSACSLRAAQLAGLVAPKTLFMKADLRQAVLTEANLMEAILAKANIRGADFRRANLFRADFARIEGDETTQFDGALRKYLRFVRPEGGMES